jgi:hypothetical protein
MTDTDTTTTDTADPEVLRGDIELLKGRIHLLKEGSMRKDDTIGMLRSLIEEVFAPFAKDCEADWIDDLRNWADGNDERAGIVRDLVGISLTKTYNVTVSVPVRITFQVEANGKDDARDEALGRVDTIDVSHYDSIDTEVEYYDAEVTHVEED